MRSTYWLRRLAMLLMLVPLTFGGGEISCETHDSPAEEAADEIEDAME